MFDIQLLEKGLSSLLSTSSKKNKVEIISRDSPPQSGTFTAEIITCIIKTEQTIEMLCKYSTGHENNKEGGHRGGVEYEAKIYEEVLNSIKLSLPHFYGSFQIADSAIFCMVLEYLNGSMRINKSLQKDRMEKAAAWIGTFHSVCEKPCPSFITKYDAPYYEQWVSNVKNIAKALKPDFAWLEKVCHHFYNHIHLLTEAPQTIIHGEFYPNNILIKENAVYPVDWESTAFAAGEIDLASLTEGYEGEKAARMIKCYLLARWPNANMETNIEFINRLQLASIYFHLRWLGRYPSLAAWKITPQKFEKFTKRLNSLHQLTKELGLI